MYPVLTICYQNDVATRSISANNIFQNETDLKKMYSGELKEI